MFENSTKTIFDNKLAAKLWKIFITKSVLLPENKYRSRMRKCRVIINGLAYYMLEQNTKKNSKFSRFAESGHCVVWLVPGWRLMVDGKFVERSQITETEQQKV